MINEVNENKMTNELNEKLIALEIVKLLLEKGANAHALYDAALRRAARNGHLEVVKLLLEKGANIHARNDNALSWAIRNGHL